MADNKTIEKKKHKSTLPAAVNAITRIYANIKRCFERKPFRFLDLPPEVRNIVYEHHFAQTAAFRQISRDKAMRPDDILGDPSEWRFIDHGHRSIIYRSAAFRDVFRRKAMLPNAILGVSRQIYSEASAVMYFDWDIKLKVTGVGKMVRESIAETAPIHVSRHTKTVYVDIYWPRSDPSDSSEEGEMI